MCKKLPKKNKKKTRVKRRIILYLLLMADPLVIKIDENKFNHHHTLSANKFKSKEGDSTGMETYLE